MSRIRDVAARAGVSSATVSRVLAGKPHVSDEVRGRVRAAAEALDYCPNRIARSLRVQRSRFIGLIVSDIQNPFFNRIVRAVEDTVLPHGFAVFLCNTDENPEQERFYLDLFLDEQVAGVILTPTQADAAAYRSFSGAGIPLAVIDRSVTGLDVRYRGVGQPRGVAGGGRAAYWVGPHAHRRDLVRRVDHHRKVAARGLHRGARRVRLGL